MGLCLSSDAVERPPGTFTHSRPGPGLVESTGSGSSQVRCCQLTFDVLNLMIAFSNDDFSFSHNQKTAFNNVEAPPLYDTDAYDVVVQPPADQPMTRTVTVTVAQPVVVPQVAQPPARPACVLPNDLHFTPSINGRNGWNFEMFYDISAEVSSNAYTS